MTAPAAPTKEAIDGAQLLNEVRDWLAAYISTVSEADLDLLTLWAVHTHLVMETYTSPRLQIDSPVHESGKTTCVEHLKRLSLRGVEMSSLASPALLTRMLDVEMRTILIDEADRSLNLDKEGIADLFAVLNSGYKRGATRPVLVPAKGGQWEVKEMPTYAPVVIAGNSPNLPDDTRSRIIRVLLLPDPDNVEETDWELIEEDAVALHDRIVDWAESIREQVRLERPGLPDGITGRFREKWSPLKRVAAAAGGRWPAAVDQMSLHDKDEYEMDKEDGLVKERPHVVLLKHIHESWIDGALHVPTEELIDRLVIAHPSVWGPESSYGKRLTAKRLGSMLAKSYKIHSVQQGHGTPRGYLLSAFTKPWRQMGVTPPPVSDESDGSDESDEGSSDTSEKSDSSDTGEGVGGSDDPHASTCMLCSQPHSAPNIACPAREWHSAEAAT
jgi:Protein of unknown function (DUF3631)